MASGSWLPCAMPESREGWPASLPGHSRPAGARSFPQTPLFHLLSFSLRSCLSHSWNTGSHFPVYSLFCSGPTLQRGDPWSHQHILPWTQKRRTRQREGLKEPVTKAPWWGWWFRRVTRSAGPPAAGPGGRMPGMLCRTEPKAEPKRGSVLSSVWEHPPSSSGPGPSLPGRGSGASQWHQQLWPKRKKRAGQLRSSLCMQYHLPLPSLALAPSPEMQPEQMTWSWSTAGPRRGLSIPKYPPLLS